MHCWQLKNKFLFVDALVPKKPESDDYDGPKEPTDIPYAHVMDKTNTPPDNSPFPSPYMALNPTAGFIARFIIQGVDTDSLLAKILVSEFHNQYDSEVDAQKDVDFVLGKMQGYLTNRVNPRKYEKPAVIKNDVHPTGQYPMDFKVNWFGTGFIKGPL